MLDSSESIDEDEDYESASEEVAFNRKNKVFKGFSDDNNKWLKPKLEKKKSINQDEDSEDEEV